MRKFVIFCTVLVQGDLNVRTGFENDYLSIDLDVGDLSGKEEGGSQPDNRKSADRKGNARGKDLLDLCKLPQPYNY